MLTCKCLNVGIESETNEFPTVTPCSLNLTFDDIKDLFFREVNLRCLYFSDPNA